jgi:elongation factor Ts
MKITANLVNALRKKTGSAMMECKKALVEANGDVEQAAEILRKRGIAQAGKKAATVVAEGGIFIKTTLDNKQAVMLEMNCQTDFVARSDRFKAYANLVASRALEESSTDLDSVLMLKVDNQSEESLEEHRQSLVATLGENIQLRRLAFMRSDGSIGAYLHGDRIGVLVQLSKDDKELGKNLAMHIAASSPRAVAAEDIPVAVIEKEREIFLAQAQGSGKPPDIIEKIVEERIKKFISGECLLGQDYVKDSAKTVGSLLASEKAKVLSFVRFSVGEGIEKKAESFVEEVMAQVRGDK